jgi:hypothetical protein
MFISERKIENGKKIAVLDSHNPMINSIFYNAEDIAIQLGDKFDEFHFQVNGCQFVMDKNTRYVDLRKQYDGYLGE